MAFVCLNEDETQVIGLFNFPQQEPLPEGYVEIDNNDERVIVFINSIEMS